MKINSGFMIIIIDGMKWIRREEKIFCGVCVEGNISFLLWIIDTNIISENDAVINDITKIIGIELFLHEIILDIIMISLTVLIVGGAEMFRAMNINHQNVMLGMMIINPLNIRVLREWYLKYKSFTKRKRAEDDIPWAIIIMTAPVNPIILKVNRVHNTNPIWATEE